MNKKTTQSVYNAKEWAKKHFAEYEDARIAKDRFNDPKSKIISSREMRKRVNRSGD